MTNGHHALHTWSHCPDCFSIITSSIPDAVGAAGKSVGVVLSRLIACICAVEVRSKSTLPSGHRRSTLGWCWYSGAKSWPELLTWAYSPPMGLYRTVIVQGLSSAHGREQRRPSKPSFSYVISIGLKDMCLYVPMLARAGIDRSQVQRDTTVTPVTTYGICVASKLYHYLVYIY